MSENPLIDPRFARRRSALLHRARNQGFIEVTIVLDNKVVRRAFEIIDILDDLNKSALLSWGGAQHRNGDTILRYNLALGLSVPND